MTLTFNRDAYSSLLAQFTPMVITTEAEYDRALAVAKQLTFAKNRTPEERSLFNLQGKRG
jgi:HTH-type transcriptional regulator / antitoxin HigA